MKDLSLVVYEMQESSLNPIGIIQEYLSLSYSPIFDEVGSFMLTVPFSLETFDLVSRQDNCEKIIYLDDGYLGICHSIKCNLSEKDHIIKIKGTLAEGLLENSVVNLVNIPKPTEIGYAKSIGTVISEKIEADPYKTWWSGISYSIDTAVPLEDGYQGGFCTYREFIENLCKYKNRGYALRFNSETNNFRLRILASSDRTVNQDLHPPVIISSDLSHIASSEFSMNSQNYKNVVVAFTRFTYNGAQTSTGVVVTYDEYPSIEDIPRKDIRASFDEITLEEPEANPTDVRSWLRVEGKKLLYQYRLVKSYDCKLINPEGAFVFGRDYFLGDKITLQDKELGLVLDAQLLEYTKTYSKNGEEFEPVFGFSQPTINRILKQKGVI